MSQGFRLIIFLLFSLNTFADVSISPSDIDFGDITIGDSEYEVILIENELNRGIRIEDISFFGDTNIGVVSYCPGYLGPYRECEIEVEVQCESYGEYEGAIDIDFGFTGHETIFIYGECS